MGQWCGGSSAVSLWCRWLSGWCGGACTAVVWGCGCGGWFPPHLTGVMTACEYSQVDGLLVRVAADQQISMKASTAPLSSEAHVVERFLDCLVVAVMVVLMVLVVLVVLAAEHHRGAEEESPKALVWAAE